jgi:hypothetical protein
MKFLELFRHKIREEDFDTISGYEDVKDIILRALDCEDNINILLSGPPASSKTLFLMGHYGPREGLCLLPWQQ